MKKLIVALLIAAFCLTVAVQVVQPVTVQAARTLEEEREMLAKLETQKKAIEKKLQDAKNKSQQIEYDKNNILEEKLIVEENLSYIRESIDIEKSLIAEYQSHIDTLNEELFQNQTKLEEYRETYGKILCYYYEYGELTTVELLLRSKNIFDFLTRLDYLKYISEYNKTVTIQISETTEKLDALISDQEAAKATLDEHLVSLQQHESELDAEILRLDEIYSELMDTIPEYNDLYQKISQEMKQIEKEILAAKQNVALLETFVEGSYSNPFDTAYWKDIVITSPCGYRINPITNKSEFHTGIDFKAPNGTPIQAVKAGTVVLSQYYGGYGETIKIQHDDGTSTLYAHCSKRYVSVGTKVLQNQVIAAVGSTGQSTGYHLHFSVIVNDEYKNPVNYLNKSFLNAVNTRGIDLGK